MKVRLVNENFTDDYVNNLLTARGIQNVQDYFKPDETYLNSPSLLKNIRTAAALYLRTIQEGNILIIVDPDVDGFTSSAIIYQYTRCLSDKCHIDWWLHEGKAHGLQEHINKLMEENYEYDLIIIPDAGSNDCVYIDMLDEIHTPCLVLDHHLVDMKLSDNAIVVNNQTSPNYPNKELTGAGVVYQFCRYIDELTGNDYAKQFIDLAALGIIGDMGGMLDMENRYFAYEGLKEENIKNSFFKALLEKQGYSITGKSDASWSDIVKASNAISVAFYIVPMINAMIRVGTMPEKERLFLAFIAGDTQVPCGKRGAKGTYERVDIESARECANAKSKQNKILDNAIFSMDVKIVNYDLLDNKVLFCRLEEDDDFPSELNGLLAMKLSAKYKKPTIVARLCNDGEIKGSARGLNQSELKDFKDFLLSSQYFTMAAGHANAFGCAIPDKDLRAFHQYANKALEDIDFGENVYDVNFSRKATSVDLSALVTALGKADGIWGQQNSQPLIYIENVELTRDNYRVMGANKDTLKIEYKGMSYLKFHAKDLIAQIDDILISGQGTLNIVGKPNINEWMGRVTPQIFIEDFEII